MTQFLLVCVGKSVTDEHWELISENRELAC